MDPAIMVQKLKVKNIVPAKPDRVDNANIRILIL